MSIQREVDVCFFPLCIFIRGSSSVWISSFRLCIVHTVYASSSMILLHCVRLCQFAWYYLFVFVLFVCVVCVHPCVHFLVCITHLRQCEKWKFKLTIWNDNSFILKLQAALTSQKESQTPETITTSVIYKKQQP